MEKISAKLQQKALAHFRKSDPILSKITQNIDPPVWRFSDNYFLALAESIVSQQLSIKAADTIFGRLHAFTEDSELSAKAVLSMEAQKMREAGLSWSKVSYVKNIAEYTLTSDAVFEKFPHMSNDEIITELTKIKGIGRWTAEMFLIFTMGRPDVFSYADLGLRRAIQKWYGFREEPTVRQMEKIADIWKPYRSIAARYLWKSTDMLKSQH